MCSMCGDIRRVVHWSDVDFGIVGSSPLLERESLRRRMRAERVRVLASILGPLGVSITEDWSSGTWGIQSRTGRSMRVENLEDLWSALGAWGIAVPDPVEAFTAKSGAV